MEEVGYVLAYRKAWTHPAFNNLREAAIWNFLYQNAFYEDGERNFNGYTFHLKRGQIVVSVKFLAEGFGMTEKGVRVVIQKLEKLGMVGKQGASRGTILTICNYDKYQLSVKPKGEPKGNRRAIEGQSKGENKNKGNKDNEKNEEKEEYIGELFSDFWNLYPNNSNKGNKKQAESKFKTVINKGVSYEEIRNGLTKYQQYLEATGFSNKHAATWLFNDGWEQDYTIKQSGSKEANQEPSYQDRLDKALAEGEARTNAMFDLA